MPVTVGTRLERLIALRDRVELEIVQERAAEAACVRTTPTPLGRPTTITPPPGGQMLTRGDGHILMRRLGITPKVVRAWAIENGYTPGDRGSLALEIVQAYADARQGVGE